MFDTSERDPLASSQQQKYLVEDIVEKSTSKSGEVFYRVKWQACKATTWEHESSLQEDVPALVAAFLS